MPWLHQQRPRPHKKDDPAFGETTRKDFKYTIRIPREWGSGKRNIQEPGSKAIHLHLPLALKPHPSVHTREQQHRAHFELQEN